MVADGKMIPLRALLRGPLRKPLREIQEKAVFESISVSYYPDTHSATLQSLACDNILGNILSEVCMCIVNVIPKLDPNMESKEMLQCEMWMAKGPTHDPVPIWGYPEEWEEVQKACWHATECGWVAFIAQMAQESNERNLWQLSGSVGNDHIKCMYSDLEY